MNQADLDAGRVYPPIPSIHEVTVKIAAHLAEHLYQTKKAWNYPGKIPANFIKFFNWLIMNFMFCIIQSLMTKKNLFACNYMIHLMNILDLKHGSGPNNTVRHE